MQSKFAYNCLRSICFCCFLWLSGCADVPEAQASDSVPLSQYYFYHQLSILNDEVVGQGSYFAMDKLNAYHLVLNTTVHPGWMLLITPRTGVGKLIVNGITQPDRLYVALKITSTSDTIDIDFSDFAELADIKNASQFENKNILRFTATVASDSDFGEFAAPVLKATLTKIPFKGSPKVLTNLLFEKTQKWKLRALQSALTDELRLIDTSSLDVCEMVSGASSNLEQCASGMSGDLDPAVIAIRGELKTKNASRSPRKSP